jgi:hypothetical protein
MYHTFSQALAMVSVLSELFGVTLRYMSIARECSPFISQSLAWARIPSAPLRKESATYTVSHALNDPNNCAFFHEVSNSRKYNLNAWKLCYILFLHYHDIWANSACELFKGVNWKVYSIVTVCDSVGSANNMNKLPEKYKEKFKWIWNSPALYFTGSCIPTNESLFI